MLYTGTNLIIQKIHGAACYQAYTLKPYLWGFIILTGNNSLVVACNNIKSLSIGIVVHQIKNPI